MEPKVGTKRALEKLLDTDLKEFFYREGSPFAVRGRGSYNVGVLINRLCDTEKRYGEFSAQFIRDVTGGKLLRKVRDLYSVQGLTGRLLRMRGVGKITLLHINNYLMEHGLPALSSEYESVYRGHTQLR